MYCFLYTAHDRLPNGNPITPLSLLSDAQSLLGMTVDNASSMNRTIENANQYQYVSLVFPITGILSQNLRSESLIALYDEALNGSFPIGQEVPYLDRLSSAYSRRGINLSPTDLQTAILALLVCENCGSPLFRNVPNAFAVQTGPYYPAALQCDSCYHRDHVRCPVCDRSRLLTSMHNISRLRLRRFSYHYGRDIIPYVCNSCFGTIGECNACHTSFFRTDSAHGHSAPDGEIYCDDCFSERWAECRHCGALLDLDSDNIRTDSDGETVCLSCYEEYSAKELIKSYSENVLNYCSMMGQGLHTGIELEVESESMDNLRSDCQAVLDSLGTDYVILKSDGSLDDTGFEIVTTPATMTIHKERFDKFFRSIPEGLHSWKGGNCGIHIHVERKGLSQLTIGKLLVFVNSPNNESLITTIAGRYASRWSQIKPKSLDATPSSQQEERYEAINLMPRNTIEFRIFRGTLNRLHFLANLEFVYSLISWARRAGRENLDQKYYLAWLAAPAHAKKYSHLVKFLHVKGIL